MNVCGVVSRLHSVQDPYVESIGSIEFNVASNAFVTAGCTE